MAENDLFRSFFGVKMNISGKKNIWRDFISAQKLLDYLSQFLGETSFLLKKLYNFFK